jgi:hypothetical protein
MRAPRQPDRLLTATLSRMTPNTNSIEPYINLNCSRSQYRQTETNKSAAISSKKKAILAPPITARPHKTALLSDHSRSRVGGRTLLNEGSDEPPERVAINEFASLEQAQAFFDSVALKNLDHSKLKQSK